MNVLITGASNGIGRDLAMVFAERTDGNIIGLSRNEKRLKEIQKKINSGKGTKSKFIPISFDLKNSDISPVIDEIKKIGSLDILINNAATLVSKEFVNFNDEEILP